ncbi:hypothetical protein, partial [Neisseria sp. P0024.S006]|uniref:hypothetical protein n=1 Tax=Neisseria sp. P0024.S006 TaxID=3436850 RepID=UPI003F7E541E
FFFFFGGVVVVWVCVFFFVGGVGCVWGVVLGVGGGVGGFLLGGVCVVLGLWCVVVFVLVCWLLVLGGVLLGCCGVGFCVGWVWFGGVFVVLVVVLCFLLFGLGLCGFWWLGCFVDGFALVLVVGCCGFGCVVLVGVVWGLLGGFLFLGGGVFVVCECVSLF